MSQQQDAKNGERNKISNIIITYYLNSDGEWTD